VRRTYAYPLVPLAPSPARGGERGGCAGRQTSALWSASRLRLPRRLRC